MRLKRHQLVIIFFIYILNNNENSEIGAFPTKQDLLDDDELDWDLDEMPDPEAARNTGFKSSRASSESSQPPNKKVRGSFNLSFTRRGSNRRNAFIPEVETDPKTLARREVKNPLPETIKSICL